MNERLRSLESSGRIGMLARALASGWRFKQHMGVSMLDLVRSAIAMARDTDMTLGQTIMAANAPMIIQQAMVQGSPQDGVLPSGQVAGLIDDLPSCTELIERIVSEAELSLLNIGATTRGETEHAI